MSKQLSPEIQHALFGRIGRRQPGPEAQIQASILEWLNLLPGCMAWRQNAGAAVIDDGNHRRFLRAGTKGMLDIMAILRGVHCEIEVKAGSNTPTDEQIHRIATVRGLDGIAFWTHSLDDCMTKLRDEFELRGWTL